MQKACELELSLKCRMKMLSHLSLEKWGPLELLWQRGQYQLGISSQLQYCVFYSDRKRERERKRKHLSKICVIAKQIWDHLLCNFRYHHAFSVSCLLFWPSDCYWSHSSFISHYKNEKMVNKFHKFTFLSKTICCFSCYCLPLKQDKPNLYCICVPATSPWKSVSRKFSTQLPIYKNLKCVGCNWNPSAITVISEACGNGGHGTE